jgi:MFS family permease
VARSRRVALDVSPLRESVAYRALWTGQIVSLLGMHMRLVAVPWQVFSLTHSSLAVGLLGLVEIVPLVAFSIWGGALADSSDRRRVMLVAQVGAMATSLALAAVSLAPRPPLVAIYALSAIASAFAAVDRPARTATVPNLVPPEQLSAAMALRQVVFQIAQIVGPALGGVMLASFDVAWVYVIDGVTYLAAVAALRWVPSGAPEAAVASGWAAVLEGVRFALRSRLITGIFAIDLVAMIFGMPRAVFPALTQETFELGPDGLGWLYAAPAAGALVGALASGWVGTVRMQGRAVLLAVTAWGMCITLAGLSLGSFPATLAFLALAGGADVISAIFRNTMLQEVTPDELRGRVSASNLVVVTGGPRLGDVEAGVVAHVTSPPASVVLGGIACLAGTVVVAARLGPLRTKTARRPSTGEAAPLGS